MNLDRFKNFNADQLQLDELITLAAFGRSLKAEYEFHQVDEPEFLEDRMKTLKREINARNAERLEARRRELTARLDTLKSPTQRKAELQKELQQIDKALAAGA